MLNGANEKKKRFILPPKDNHSDLVPTTLIFNMFSVCASDSINNRLLLLSLDHVCVVTLVLPIFGNAIIIVKIVV